ncbi:MAG: hypothetical protein KGN16_17755 [Burkholderiales bacterium]|nr:hypothetical protein [Burkholderiales bacterium]
MALAAACTPPAQAQGKPVYRCPGPPVLYTDGLTPQEAREKGCRALEGAPITIVPAVRPRAAPPPVASRPGEGRVDPADQRKRDADARQILADELARQQQKLAGLQQAYNNGEPERQGDERNYQKYLDRVAEMKAAIDRTQADIAAIQREIAKLPGS